MASQPQRHLSVEEYLKQEETSIDKHEYLNGEVFVMAGGTPAHSVICSNIIASLNTQLAEHDCTVRDSNMALRTSPNGLYSYADAVVSCPPEQFEGNVLLNPRAIVEVLSESTESYDRGKKFELYRQIESFAEYTVVAQDRFYVEHHVRRQDRSSWIMTVFTDPNAAIAWQSIPVQLRLAGIYRKVLSR